MPAPKSDASAAPDRTAWLLGLGIGTVAVLVGLVLLGFLVWALVT